MDWILYDKDLRHERANKLKILHKRQQCMQHVWECLGLNY